MRTALDEAREAGCCRCVWSAVVVLHDGHCCVRGTADCHQPQFDAIINEREAKP